MIHCMPNTNTATNTYIIVIVKYQNQMKQEQPFVLRSIQLMFIIVTNTVAAKSCMCLRAIRIYFYFHNNGLHYSINQKKYYIVITN